jgi:hypothetical protein
VDGGGVEVWAGDRDVRNLYIHHNYAYRCAGFFEIGGRGYVVGNIRTTYNLLVDCFGLSFLYFNTSGDYTIEIQDYLFENNTMVVHDCGEERIWTCVAFAVEVASGVFTMRNNLFHVHNADRILWNAEAASTSNNLVYHAGTDWFDPNFTLSATDIIGEDPLLVDIGTCVEEGDYRLQLGSPAIDAGAELGYAFDIQGYAVPAGQAPDIGAYEYTEGVTINRTLQRNSSCRPRLVLSGSGPYSGNREIFVLQSMNQTLELLDIRGRRIYRTNGIYQKYYKR